MTRFARIFPVAVILSIALAGLIVFSLLSSPEPTQTEVVEKQAQDTGSQAPAGVEEPVHFGRVVLHPKRRVLRIPAVVVQDGNTGLEYFAGIKGGRQHEAIFSVLAEGHDINFAMLAAVYEAGGMTDDEGRFVDPWGAPVFMSVEWDVNEAAERRRAKDAGTEPGEWTPGEKKLLKAEDLMLNKVTGKTMIHTAWIFNGSRVRRDRTTGRMIFMADVSGVFATLMRDADAILNLPLDTAAMETDDTIDTVYVVNSGVVPPKGTHVDLLLAPATPEDVQTSDLPAGYGKK